MNKNKVIAIIVKVIFAILVISFFYWAVSNQMLSHIYEDREKFFTLINEHLIIVFISGALAILLAVPLGVLVTRSKYRKLEWPIVNIANLGQTIPSLAILALAMSFLGIGIKAAILALFIYSVLPILQNTIAGLHSVDPETIDAARGMGLTPGQILWRIELPNSIHSIVAGVRTALVINIGTAALAYLIGGGGLGVWIFTGIQLFDNSYLVSGALPVIFLAISVDYLLRGLQYILEPKGIRLAKKALYS